MWSPRRRWSGSAFVHCAPRARRLGSGGRGSSPPQGVTAAGRPLRRRGAVHRGLRRGPAERGRRRDRGSPRTDAVALSHALGAWGAREAAACSERESPESSLGLRTRVGSGAFVVCERVMVRHNNMLYGCTTRLSCTREHIYLPGREKSAKSMNTHECSLARRPPVGGQRSFGASLST